MEGTQPTALSIGSKENGRGNWHGIVSKDLEGEVIKGQQGLWLRRDGSDVKQA